MPIAISLMALSGTPKGSTDREAVALRQSGPGGVLTRGLDPCGSCDCYKT